MRFTHKQLTLIQTCLRVAAAQFAVDRDIAIKANQPRVANQFYAQQTEANELAEWIDNQE